MSHKLTVEIIDHTDTPDTQKWYNTNISESVNT